VFHDVQWVSLSHVLPGRDQDDPQRASCSTLFSYDFADIIGSNLDSHYRSVGPELLAHANLVLQVYKHPNNQFHQPADRTQIPLHFNEGREELAGKLWPPVQHLFFRKLYSFDRGRGVVYAVDLGSYSQILSINAFIMNKIHVSLGRHDFEFHGSSAGASEAGLMKDRAEICSANWSLRGLVVAQDVQ
jgi:hypothetical protein